MIYPHRDIFSQGRRELEALGLRQRKVSRHKFLASRSSRHKWIYRVLQSRRSLLMDSRSCVSMRAMPLARQCFARQNHQTGYRYPAHMLQGRATDFKILGKEDWDVDGTSQKHLRREAGTSYLESNLLIMAPSSLIPRGSCPCRM